MLRKIQLMTLFGLGLVLTSSLSGCRKEQDTLAKITIVDTDGNPFAGAEVRIYGEPTLTPPPGEVIIDRTLYTDANGQVIFDFTDDFKLGQAGFAVLMLEVNSDDDLLHAEGIIKIEEEKMNEETLVIQPF